MHWYLNGFAWTQALFNSTVKMTDAFPAAQPGCRRSTGVGEGDSTTRGQCYTIQQKSWLILTNLCAWVLLQLTYWVAVLSVCISALSFVCQWWLEALLFLSVRPPRPTLSFTSVKQALQLLFEYFVIQQANVNWETKATVFCWSYSCWLSGSPLLTDQQHRILEGLVCSQMWEV